MRGAGLVAVLVGLVILILYRVGYRLNFKNGVVTAFAPEIARVLPAINAAHYDADIGERKDDSGRGFYGAFITSGTEGVHKTGSLHYVGQALDLRTRDLNFTQVENLLRALRRRLGSAYDVVDETFRQSGPHIHVEYDPKN